MSGPKDKHVQLAYARAMLPGVPVHPGTHTLGVYAVLRHEPAGRVLALATPDEHHARYEAGRWAQDTGVAHTVKVATLVLTLEEGQ